MIIMFLDARSPSGFYAGRWYLFNLHEMWQQQPEVLAKYVVHAYDSVSHHHHHQPQANLSSMRAVDFY